MTQKTHLVRGRSQRDGDRLFIGVYSTGISYADKQREQHGDYAKCAFLDFETLTLKFYPGCPASLKKEIERDAAKIQARRGESYPVSGSGHTVILGGRNVMREAHHVADFNTLDDLLEHARGEGATHFLQIDDETHIYFRRSDGKYEKAEAWQKDGYWHTQAPGSRAVVPRPPRGARAIGQHAQGAAPKHFASEANDAKDVLDGLGRYLEHEGHDAAREASRIARFIRGARSERKVEEALEEVNKLIGGHGVEAIRDQNAYDNYYGDVIATYVNMGDTYDATLLYDVRNNEFHITSWGDWYEQYEQQRDAEREEEAPESEPYDEDLEETRASVSMKKFEVISADGRVIAHITAPNIEQARRDLTHWYPKGSTVRPSVRSARESAIVHDYIAVDPDVSAAIESWNRGDAYRDGSLQVLIDTGLVVHGRRGWEPTAAGHRRGLNMGHLEEARESPAVRESDDDVAWKVLQGDKSIDTVDFPPNMSAEEVRQTLIRDGFPSDIEVRKARLGPRRRSNESSVVRDYNVIDSRGRKLAGPFKSQSEANDAAARAGGHVEFVPARRGLPPGAPKPPSAYPMFREASRVRHTLIDDRTGEALRGKVSRHLRGVLSRVQSTCARFVNGEWVEDSCQDPRARAVRWGRPHSGRDD